ncbi:unnamed protein product [Moneuplotes crassus]|uniref:Dystroglycan-type cadherin-like domain-containing protein n=1 Tax=Euplotes crassus TaxID=5936 RepID=A0AAD1XI63_EUPCR|nr:unnamed protein product [Moneuplotes crassus]
MQVIQVWATLVIVLGLLVAQGRSACVNTNYYKSLASASFNSIYKSPTGDDYTVIAATISSICRLSVLNQAGVRVAEVDLGDSTTNQVVCNKVYISDTGKVYVTGSTKTLDASSGKTNIFIGIYDKNTLAASLVRGWGSYSGDEVGLDIKATADEGYLYAVGYSDEFTQNSGGKNPVVTKFQPDGTHIWSKGIGGNAIGEFSSVDFPIDASNIYCVGTTRIWTVTTNFDTGVIVKISSAGSLQWVRSYGTASTHVKFNTVVCLKDHSYVWVFGNSGGSSGILVKFDISTNQDTLTLTLSTMSDITSASLYIDQSVIFFAGQSSASKMYVGGLKLSDDSLILNKYFDVASSTINDISINHYGQIGIAATVGANGGIIHFDPDFNDKCTALTITAFGGSLSASVGTISTSQASQTLYDIQPLIVTGTISSSSVTTTLTNETCGDMCVPNFVGISIATGNSISQNVATFNLNTTVAAITYSSSLMDDSSSGWVTVSSGGTLSNSSSSGLSTYIKVKGSYTDGSTYTASSMYRIIVTNNAPTLSASIPDQTVAVNTAFSLGFSTSAFTDSDSGDSLTYTAEQSSGSVLPSWLSFDAANRAFSGTPTSAGTLNVRAKATDTGGSVVSDIFTITITNNDPVSSTAIPSQNLVVGEYFEYSIPSGSFTDANGHTVTYVSATQTDLTAIPSWLTFISSAGLFSGVPTASGTTSIRVTATDVYGGTDPTSDFNFIVSTRPTVTPYSDLTRAIGGSISVSTPFVDADGDTLTYSAAYINGSSTITPYSLSAAGLLTSSAFTSSEEGSYSIKVTATDTSSNSISSTQNVIVNSAPVANQSALVQLYAIHSEAFSYTLPSTAFSSTDALTYSIDGTSTNPAWLNFDATQRLFYGTANSGQANPALTIIATDTIGQTATVILNITVNNDNAPAFSNAVSSQTIKKDANFSITFPDNIFSDADGDPVEISFERNAGGSMPSWWSFNPITRIASGFVNTTENSIVIKIWGGTSASTTFTLTILDNNAPVVGTAISSFTVYQDIDFTEAFSSTSFVDPDADTLTYYLSAVDNDSSLPFWINIQSSNMRIYGRAGSSDLGKYQVNLVADDSRGGTAFQTLTITVKATYSIPAVLALSILVILPVASILIYLSLIIFGSHESPKYQFNLDKFLQKYDPDYTAKKLKKEDEDKIINDS